MQKQLDNMRREIFEWKIMTEFSGRTFRQYVSIFMNSRKKESTYLYRLAWRMIRRNCAPEHAQKVREEAHWLHMCGYLGELLNLFHVWEYAFKFCGIPGNLVSSFAFDFFLDELSMIGAELLIGGDLYLFKLSSKLLRTLSQSGIVFAELLNG